MDGIKEFRFLVAVMEIGYWPYSMLEIYVFKVSIKKINTKAN